MNGSTTLTVGGEFDGIGLLALGLHLAGLEHAWLCEVDPWRRSILEKRFPGVPVFDDVRAVGAASARRVDVIAGGFPCKGASTAGKREGFGHPETVLWREMRRSIGELRPRYVLIENVANLLALHDGAVWGEVLGDLAALGFDVVWDCLPAAAVGAPHRRDRVFAVVTHAGGEQHAKEQAGDVGIDVERAAVGGRAELAAGVGGLAAPDGRGIPRPHARSREPAAGHGAPAADPPGRSTRLLPEDAQGGLATEPHGGGGEAPADADDDRRPRRAQRDVSPQTGQPAPLRHDPSGRGVQVDWGEFGPAVERWESVHGPAPEPLVRRVDDGGARRVERSRLSALGDGVQVQIGQIAGRYIVERERERVGA